MSKTRQAPGQSSAAAAASAAPRYTIEIKWSDEDQAYVVILPEWADRYVMPVASGRTYEAAAARGRNALENYIVFCTEDGAPLPEANTYAPSEG